MCQFVPKITVFVCDLSSYAGSKEILAAKVTCPPRVDPSTILNEFLGGSDGVLVPACNPDECEHVSGTLHTRRNVEITKRLMEEIGLAVERLLLADVSPEDREGLVKVAGQFKEEIADLGPIRSERGLKKEELDNRLKAAVNASGSKRVKWLVGRERPLVTKQNEFGESVPQDFYDSVTDDAVREEYLASGITLLLEGQQMSVRELSEKMGVPADRILMSVMELRASGKVAVSEVRGKSPLYKVK